MINKEYKRYKKFVKSIATENSNKLLLKINKAIACSNTKTISDAE